jgi:hypothetical protein
MAISVTSNIYHPTKTSLWEEEMVGLLKNNPYWRDRVTADDKSKLKLYQPYNKYILSQGSTAYKFVIYYLKNDESIQMDEFSLEYGSKSWYFKNGCDNRLTDLKELFNYILRPH